VEADKVMTLFNKSDLVGETTRPTGEALWISARTGTGLESLKRSILKRLEPNGSESEPDGSRFPLTS
jgi:50S ribosomal subunit-associated GTPase HflX